MTPHHQKTTKITRVPGQNLAAPNEVGNMEYEPGAYLADGGEYLPRAACKVGISQNLVISKFGRYDAKIREVSLLYPSSEPDGPVEIRKIPMGGLVLQLHRGDDVEELDEFQDGSIFITKAWGKLLLVGIPIAVYRALQNVIGHQADSYEHGHGTFWYSAMPPQDDHHWMYAAADSRLKTFVYIDGERKEVDVNALMAEVPNNVKCDAFVALSLARSPWTGGRWKLDMVIKEMLITGTTDAEARLSRGRELVGRKKYSSPDIVDAFKKVQVAGEEAKATTST